MDVHRDDQLRVPAAYPQRLVRWFVGGAAMATVAGSAVLLLLNPIVRQALEDAAGRIAGGGQVGQAVSRRIIPGLLPGASPAPGGSPSPPAAASPPGGRRPVPVAGAGHPQLAAAMPATPGAPAGGPGTGSPAAASLGLPAPGAGAAPASPPPTASPAAKRPHRQGPKPSPAPLPTADRPRDAGHWGR